MLTNYLRRHFGIRNIDTYLDLYRDLRGAYEFTDELNVEQTVKTICANLHGKISVREESLLLLRLMEFCGYRADGPAVVMFRTMADEFHTSESDFADFSDYVEGRETEHVMIHHLANTDGQVKTLLKPETGQLLFTYTGNDTVMLNDVPVLSGAYQVWMHSSVLKGKGGVPYY